MLLVATLQFVQLLLLFVRMEQLSSRSTKEAANNKVILLVQDGATNEEAFAIVSAETGQSASAIKSYFFQLGGNNEGIHGNSKLDKEEESQLVSMLIVFSIMHEAVTIKGMQEFVEKILGRKLENCGLGTSLRGTKMS